MILRKVEIDCQTPVDNKYCSRIFNIVECRIEKNSDRYNQILANANELAQKVNSGAANNSEYARNLERRLIDSFGGLLAEQGWELYINSIFGEIASPTPFLDASVQIDIQLTNGEKLEVRSSFPYKGVKFALCNNAANFKNIGPYANSIKPGEIQKNMYLAVLFDTPKKQLLIEDTIVFSLVCGSTWNMMVQNGTNVTLAPWDDDSFALKSNYRVIFLKDALDSLQVLDSIEVLNYKKL